MEFLGYTIGEGEISPQAQKVHAIIEYAAPRNKREVRSLLADSEFLFRLISDSSIDLE